MACIAVWSEAWTLGILKRDRQTGRQTGKILDELLLQRQIMGKTDKCSLRYVGHANRNTDKSDDDSSQRIKAEGQRGRPPPASYIANNITEVSGLGGGLQEMVELSRDRERWPTLVVAWRGAPTNDSGDGDSCVQFCLFFGRLLVQ